MECGSKSMGVLDVDVEAGRSRRRLRGATASTSPRRSTSATPTRQPAWPSSTKHWRRPTRSSPERLRASAASPESLGGERHAQVEVRAEKGQRLRRPHGRRVIFKWGRSARQRPSQGRDGTYSAICSHRSSTEQRRKRAGWHAVAGGAGSASRTVHQSGPPARTPPRAVRLGRVRRRAGSPAEGRRRGARRRLHRLPHQAVGVPPTRRFVAPVRHGRSAIRGRT